MSDVGELMKQEKHKLLAIILLIVAATIAVYFLGKGNAVLDCQTLAAKLDASLAQETQQLVVVKPRGGIDAKVMTCVRLQNKWQPALAEFPVVLGKSGVAVSGEKKEGDKKTPSGLYPLGEAFGSLPMSLKMDYKYITKEDKFVDDPQHKNYNSWVTGATDAKSFETMLIPQYKMGLVINYNMNPVVPGAGSAIFMHIWSSPKTGTFGCVAASEDSMRSLLQWLDKDKQPYIYIFSKNV